MMIKLLRLGDLLDGAVVHDHDAVGERHGLDLIMGDINCCGLHHLVDAFDFDAHLRPQLGVEI